MLTTQTSKLALCRGIYVCISRMSTRIARVRHPFHEKMIKINPKVYDVINWLNKNLKTYVWYLEEETRSYIETWSIDRVLRKDIFMEKVCWKCTPKAGPRPFFKQPKTVNACKKLLKIRYFERGLLWAAKRLEKFIF